jgi:hypothetical protein
MIKPAKTLLVMASTTVALMAVAWAADPPAAAPPAAAAPTTPAPQSSGDETEASCLLKITADPAIFPLEPMILEYLLATSGVKDDAIKEVVRDGANVEITLELVGGGGITTAAPPGGAAAGGPGMPGMGPMGPGAGPRGGPGMMSPFGGAARGGMVGASAVALPDSAEQMLMGHLKVVSNDERHARQIMVAVTKRFQAALEKIGKEELQRLSRDSETVSRQAMDARARMEELQKVRQDMLAGTPFNDLSRDSVLEMSRKFETERQEAAVKLESLRARNDAFQKHIAVAGAEAKDLMARQQAQAAEAQSLKARLEELQAKQEELKKRSEAVAVPPEQLKERAAQVRSAAEALGQLQAAMAAQAPGKRVSELNDQMSTLSIDLTETEARLKILDAKCKEMRDLLSKADEFELRVGLELPLAKSTYEGARLRQRDIEYRISAIHLPSVSVIGG